MEPQVWVPWVIAVLAPAAVLLSQWLNNRDRAADRAQALELDSRTAERALEDHWRDRRLEAHSRFIEAARRAYRRWDAEATTGQPPDEGSDGPSLSAARAEVELLGSEATAKLSERVSTYVYTAHAWSQGLVANRTEPPVTNEDIRKEFRSRIDAYIQAARMELGTAPRAAGGGQSAPSEHQPG
jgi:type II secretory pathway pseudopilin PulG